MRLKPRLSRFQYRLFCKTTRLPAPKPQQNLSRPHCPHPTTHTHHHRHTPLSTPTAHTHHHPHHCPRCGCARQGNSRMARRTWAAPSGREQDEGGRLEAEGRGPGMGPAHAPTQQMGPEDLSACLNRMYQVPGILTHTLPSLPKGCCRQSDERNNTRKTSHHEWGGPGVSCTPGSVPPGCKPGPRPVLRASPTPSQRRERMTSE